MFRRAFWLLLFAVGSTVAQDLPSGPLPESGASDIGYQSVATALASLTGRKDVNISTVRDWTIITDTKNLTVWSFAPASYSAYPAVVRRVVRARSDGGSDIDMSVLCEASKEACDQLVREFVAMNKRI
jgi:hypothetical protein